MRNTVNEWHHRFVLPTFFMALAIGTVPCANAYEFHNNAKWDPGLNTGSFYTPSGTNGPETPGGASWSAVPSGTAISIWGSVYETHGGIATDIEYLITPAADGLEYAIFNAAFEVWTEPARIDNLGMVTDSGAGIGELETNDGHIGDIRVAAFAFDGTANTLAHAFPAGTESMYGQGGTIAGDVHFDVDEIWLDDPADDTAVQDYDFYTLAIHEIGHALGLDHTVQGSGAVMDPFYIGARRALTADDIAGIQAIYGARMTGDTDKDDDVDIGGDIFAAFDNFSGPNTPGQATNGMRLAEGDVDFDDDVDVTDIILMFENFTGPSGPPDDAGSGGLTAASAADPNIPDLIYNAATGEVILDPDGSTIVGYSLTNGTNSFLAGNHTPILAGAVTSLSFELAEVSLTSTLGPLSIGSVFPVGLDLSGLLTMLTSFDVSRGLGAETVSFDLVVLDGAVPEPSTFVVAGMALAGLISLAGRRKRRAPRSAANQAPASRDASRRAFLVITYRTHASLLAHARCGRMN